MVFLLHTLNNIQDRYQLLYKLLILHHRRNSTVTEIHVKTVNLHKNKPKRKKLSCFHKEIRSESQQQVNVLNPPNA